MLMKNLLLTLVTLLSAVATQAQESTYQPLVREGVRWYYGFFNNVEGSENADHSQCYYEFKGDTIINGNVYKKLYRTVIQGNFSESALFDKQLPVTTLECCMIENNKVVYAVYNRPNYVYDKDYRFMEHPTDGVETKYGIMLYDFNQPAESLSGHGTIQGVKCNQFTTKFVFDDDDSINMTLIEGFGYKNEGWLLYSTLPYPYIPRPTCCKGWYFIQFTDTDGKVIFDPNKDVYSGINDIKAGTVKSDTGYYNLQGQAVDIKSAPAGIYIHNGKKVVVK